MSVGVTERTPVPKSGGGQFGGGGIGPGSGVVAWGTGGGGTGGKVACGGAHFGVVSKTVLRAGGLSSGGFGHCGSRLMSGSQSGDGQVGCLGPAATG